MLNIVQRSFRVEAERGLGSKPRPELIGPILTAVRGSLQDAVRMEFLHSSRPRGRVSAALTNAADVRFIGHEGSGSHTTVLRFELPRFGSAVPAFFQQPTLWEDGPSPDETAFEALGGALTDVAAQRADSARFDSPFLRRISRYRTILNRGIHRVTLEDGPLSESAKIDTEVVMAASRLAAVTPSPRRARVAGRLDVMGASQGILKIEVRPGEIVTALWDRDDEPIETYHALFNRDVVIEGLAVFRPSGVLLRLDADVIEPASSQVEIFREVPRAPVIREYRKVARLKPKERSAYVQLLGAFPANADDSDEVFQAAVEALR